MLPEEQRIIAIKYKSKRIGDFSVDELLLHSQGLALKTCVITGWQIPDSKEYMNIFDDQLRKFLVDEYQDINIDEYEYAMRVYGTQIIDWGKSMNLSLIRQSLDAYLSARSELSKMEEHKRPEPPKEIDPGPVDWSDTWEKLMKGEIRGVMLELTPLPTIYDWAVRTGLISPTNREKWQLVIKARENAMRDLQNKKDAMKATYEDKEMMERLRAIDWMKDTVATTYLINPLKILAILSLIKPVNNE